MLRCADDYMDGHAHDQMDGRTDTNFENNLAKALSNNPGFTSIIESCFKLESGKHNMDRHANAQNG